MVVAQTGPTSSHQPTQIPQEYLFPVPLIQLPGWLTRDPHFAHPDPPPCAQQTKSAHFIGTKRPVIAGQGAFTACYGEFPWTAQGITTSSMGISQPPGYSTGRAAPSMWSRARDQMFDFKRMPLIVQTTVETLTVQASLWVHLINLGTTEILLDTGV